MAPSSRSLGAEELGLGRAGNEVGPFQLISSRAHPIRLVAMKQALNGLINLELQRLQMISLIRTSHLKVRIKMHSMISTLAELLSRGSIMDHMLILNKTRINTCNCLKFICPNLGLNLILHFSKPLRSLLNFHCRKTRMSIKVKL